MRATSLLALACSVGLTAGHGILQVPKARTGQANGVGIKLRPFADAVTVANAGCGGAAGGDSGPTITKSATYTAGSSIKVEWDVTIPHPIDNTNTGIRIAVRYADGDSYGQNILAGPGSPAANGLQTVTAQAQTGLVRNSIIVQLPPGKTSDDAVIQWMWAAQNDGGFYLGCSDVAITNGVPTPLTPTPPPTRAPTNAPGVTPAPTPPPAGIPTVQIEFEIRGDQNGATQIEYDNQAVFDALTEQFADFYNVTSSQIVIAHQAVPEEGGKAAGVRVTLTISELSKESAKAVVNQSTEGGLATVFNAVPGFQGAAPKITDWTMCNTGDEDGCTSSVKVEDSTPVATFALIALAVPIVAVGVIVGLGGKKSRALLLNGERS